MILVKLLKQLERINMSITFFLKNHNESVKLECPNFNPHEPEDPIYNSRYTYENVYPNINLSNINAARFLELFQNISKEEIIVRQGSVGSLSYKEIEILVLKIYQTKSKLVANLLEPSELGPFTIDEKDYLIKRLETFERVFRYAIALNDEIVWA